MSYFTDFSLEVYDANEKDYRAIDKEIEKLNIFDSGDAECGCYGTATWNNVDEDMKLLSARFPDVIFKLRGDGEDRDDMWIHYYKGGRVMNDGLVVTIVEDAFDESKLDGEATVDIGQKYSCEK